MLELTGTGSDGLIDAAIGAASETIITQLEREFAPAVGSATRRFPIPVDEHVIDLTPYDLRSVASLSLHPESGTPELLTASAYLLEPVVAKFGVYTKIRIASDVSLSSATARRFGYALADVAGAWGFATVPAEVKRAAIDTVCSWVDRAVAVYGDPNDENPRMIRPDRFGGWAIPKKALQELNPFKRMTAIA